MRRMKKSVFTVLVALMLCGLTLVSVSAIDTPWLPLTPDGGNEDEATSTTAVTTEETNTPNSEEESIPQSSEQETQPSQTQDGSVASSQSKETANDSAPTTDANRTESADEPSRGCNGTVSGFGWMAVLSGTWVVCRENTQRKRK